MPNLAYLKNISINRKLRYKKEIKMLRHYKIKYLVDLYMSQVDYKKYFFN
jgi:hypothetical protein